MLFQIGRCIVVEPGEGQQNVGRTVIIFESTLVTPEQLVGALFYRLEYQKYGDWQEAADDIGINLDTLKNLRVKHKSGSKTDLHASTGVKIAQWLGIDLFYVGEDGQPLWEMLIDDVELVREAKGMGTTILSRNLGLSKTTYTRIRKNTRNGGDSVFSSFAILSKFVEDDMLSEEWEYEPEELEAMAEWIKAVEEVEEEEAEESEDIWDKIYRTVREEMSR